MLRILKSVFWRKSKPGIADNRCARCGREKAAKYWGVEGLGMCTSCELDIFIENGGRTATEIGYRPPRRE